MDDILNRKKDCFHRFNIEKATDEKITILKEKKDKMIVINNNDSIIVQKNKKNHIKEENNSQENTIENNSKDNAELDKNINKNLSAIDHEREISESQDLKTKEDDAEPNRDDARPDIIKKLTQLKQNEDINSIKKQSFDEGFKAGFEQCIQEKNTLETNIIEKIENELEKKYSENISAISVAIAKKITLDTVQDDNNQIIITYINHILNKIEASQKIKIEIFPSFLPHIKQYFNNMDNIVFIENKNIDKYNCNIDWCDGYSSYSMQDKINAFLDILSDK